MRCAAAVQHRLRFREPFGLTIAIDLGAAGNASTLDRKSGALSQVETCATRTGDGESSTSDLCAVNVVCAVHGVLVD